jgi:outer membrane protein assembly factor BamE (lipoprotein component of BamABCDE complex)
MYLILGIYLLLLLSGTLAAGVLWMHRRSRAATQVLLVTFVLVLFWYRLTALDRVASWLYSSDTEYAPGFSEQAFSAISEGVDHQEVLKSLGKPINQVSLDGREYWHYSQPGDNSDNYWNVIVIVDTKSGKVVELFREFYTD